MTLQDAINLAVEAHDTDVDKAGLPYILHPFRVLNAVIKVRPLDLDAQVAAVLHDVLEDHPQFFWRYVADGLTERQFDIINDVTRAVMESYDEFIARVLASDNEASRLIKAADMVDNMTRPSTPMVREKALAKYMPHLPKFGYLVEDLGR